MPFTNASTWSPDSYGRSSTTAVASRSTTWLAGPRGSRKRPGSPWMPMPISISSSGRSKLGSPDPGVMQAVSAMPMLRPWPFTRRQISATSASDLPSSAAAPQIFSAITVMPTPRRPAVYRLSWTATSSLVTTASTWMSSPPARSAAISKFITSPV